MSAFEKACSCCGTVHDRESWRRLPAVGLWDVGDDVLSLRNCDGGGVKDCGSTIAVSASEEEAA